MDIGDHLGMVFVENDKALSKSETQKKDVRKELEQAEAQKNELKKQLEQIEKQWVKSSERATFEQKKADELVSWLAEERKKWQKENGELERRNIELEKLLDLKKKHIDELEVKANGIQEKLKEMADSGAHSQVLIVKQTESIAQLQEARNALITMVCCYERNKRRRRSDPDPEVARFPFEIIVEILSWLPVQSLLRFKCVCKQWHLLITQDHKFIKKHMCQARPLQLVYEYKQQPYATIVIEGNFKLVDCCSGLFLENNVTNSEVWRIRNPATHQVLYLPDVKHKGICKLDFVFSSVTGKCKVVCGYLKNAGSILEAGFCFEVITIGKDDQWRSLKTPSCTLKHGKWALVRYFVRQGTGGVRHFVKVITDGRDVCLEVQSLNLWSECVTTTTLPRGVFLDLNRVRAVCWNHSLVVAGIVEEALNFLVLEDYKEQKWSENKIIVPLKFLKDDPLLKDQIVPVYLGSDGFLFRKGGGETTLSYDRKKEIVKETQLVELVNNFLAIQKPSLWTLKGMKPE